MTACLTGLGAESLKVNDTYTGETLRDYDVVLVANKAKKTAALPDEIANAPNGCDVQWLKRICVSCVILAIRPRNGTICGVS